MKTVEIAGRKVEIYDSVEELPMVRFHRYNKFLLVDAGVGSDIGDFDRHIEKAMIYARSRTPDLAVAELENLRQNVYMIQQQVSPRFLSFAALVKSIDGRACNDLSDEGLQRVVDCLAQAPVGKLTALFEAVKKKIDEELRQYFPKVFEDATAKEYYDELRHRTLLVLDEIINGCDRRAEIDRLTEELMMYSKPQMFSGSESVEILHDRQFERMCLVMAQTLNIEPKRYTVMEFYSAFELLQDQTRERERAYKRRK